MVNILDPRWLLMTFFLPLEMLIVSVWECSLCLLLLQQHVHQPNNWWFELTHLFCSIRVCGEWQRPAGRTWVPHSWSTRSVQDGTESNSSVNCHHWPSGDTNRHQLLLKPVEPSMAPITRKHFGSLAVVLQLPVIGVCFLLSLLQNKKN